MTIHFCLQTPSIVHRCFDGFPAIVVKILRVSFFDCRAALAAINDGSIADIEEFLEDHREILDDSVYSKQFPFKFLPGHKAIILAIPKRMIESPTRTIARYDTDCKRFKTKFLSNKEIDAEIGQLLKRLLEYSQRIGLSIQLTRADVHDFQQTCDRYICRVTCTLCGKTISCFKKNYWIAVNIVAHLKQHANYNYNHQIEMIKVENEVYKE